MNKSFVIAMALILALFQVSKGKAITDQAQKDIILNKHNEMRRMAANGGLSSLGFSTAARMYPLTWDAELANVADRLASTCNFNHNVYGYGYGQNIAMGGGAYAQPGVGVPNEQPSGSGICSNCFADENEAIKFLQYGWISGSGEESQGPNGLNHFTQMVDDDTFRIGCALNSNCGSDEYYLVCNYDPAGNLVGTPAYATGATASQCPSGNNDGLCSGTPIPDESGSSGSESSGGSSGGSSGASGSADTLPSLQQICQNSGGSMNMHGSNGRCTYVYQCWNGISQEFTVAC